MKTNIENVSMILNAAADVLGTATKQLPQKGDTAETANVRPF